MTNTEVKYKLLKSYCMPLYGCSLWDFFRSTCKQILCSMVKMYQAFMNVPYNTHCKLLHSIIRYIPVEMQLHKRFMNFAKEVMLSNNSLIKLCFKLEISGSCFGFCNSSVFIKYSYKMESL